MVELVLVLVAAVGLAHLVVDSTIFERYVKRPLWGFLYERTADGRPVVDVTGKKKLRKDTWLFRRLEEVDEMMGCYQCAGFWGGIVAAGLWAVAGYEWMGWARMVLFGLATSYLGMLGATLLFHLNGGTGGQDGPG